MSVQSVALASLTATYTDSDGEDGLEDEIETNPKPAIDDRETNVNNNSPKSSSNSPTSIDNKNHNTKHNIKNNVQRLVSYIDDTVVSDDEGGLATIVHNEIARLKYNKENGIISSKIDNASLKNHSISDYVNDNDNDDNDDIKIPPEPAGHCPIELQEKISLLFKKMEHGGLDMNKLIQQRKDFRNPSIYEKLIQFCGINELGTNYSVERFDPFRWSKDSYYEELAKVQKAEMDKLEKARKEKTKIEIVSGTAKRPNSSVSNSDDDAKKRKSKWDQVATGAPVSAVKPALLLPQPTLTTLTSSAAKATVISAFGSLPKKRL
uniref:SAP30-binding protein n=1 Tax=Bracon brevicornis TaxID=1563983 RepID=A0A6V7KUH6_9HYME